ncbi:MAG: TIGR02452 family protein, partial [Pirellula sp.]|nr:TIGR02452 family protein [Pirellula sp.]
LVLGAWGCEKFGNDPLRTAEDFKSVIVNDFNRQFADIVFAIADWSPQRRLLNPFRDVFGQTSN